MATSRLLRALHVVGYVTTTIVLVETVVIALAIWWPAHRTAVRVSKATRTYERPLDGRSEERLTALAGKAFAPIRPPADGTGDAFGFVLMPSFSSWTAMSVSGRRTDRAARGLVVEIRHGDAGSQLTFGPIKTFSLPMIAYRDAARRLDALTDGFGGNTQEPCYDGEAIAFERRRGVLVTSGGGQAGCSEKHYLAVKAIMEDVLRRYAPSAAPAGATARRTS